jgi:hypothetical protein
MGYIGMALGEWQVEEHVDTSFNLTADHSGPDENGLKMGLRRQRERSRLRWSAPGCDWALRGSNAPTTALAGPVEAGDLGLRRYLVPILGRRCRQGDAWQGLLDETLHDEHDIAWNLRARGSRSIRGFGTCVASPEFRGLFSCRWSSTQSCSGSLLGTD